MKREDVLELVGDAVRRALGIAIVPVESVRTNEHGADVFARGMRHPVSYRYRPPHGEAVLVIEGREGAEAVFPVPRELDAMWADAVARKVVEYVRAEQAVAASVERKAGRWPA